MPSKDKVSPKANAWMEQDGVRRTSVTPKDLRERKQRRQMAAQLLRLARRLHADPDELAKRIPEETLRRLKFPVIEEVLEDGSRVFKHDQGIEEGPRSS